MTAKSSLTYVHAAVLAALAASFFMRKGALVRDVQCFLLPALVAHCIALSAARIHGQCSATFVVPVASIATQILLVLTMCHTDHPGLLALLQFASALHICIFPAGESIILCNA